MSEGLGVRPEELLKHLKHCEYLLSGWCNAVDEIGTGWDDWDYWYKQAAYDGTLEALRTVIAKAEGK